MSRIVEFPARRTPVRTAVLDLVARSGLGPEEAEFLEALRGIVARTPAEHLWEKWRGDRPDDRAARIFARYAD
jgi:hypothetical protein